ncbi:hypothetical protein EJB05_26269, partial [Eragrostis curvula]
MADVVSRRPDDLQRRVLQFAAVKEAVSAAVLSRRWHRLCLTSGVVSFYIRSYDRVRIAGGFSLPKSDAFLHGAARSRRCPRRRDATNKGPNCFGLQQAKFFADNSQVLQELHVDDASHELDMRPSELEG